LLAVTRKNDVAHPKFMAHQFPMREV
jgi:hypothetical protein